MPIGTWEVPCDCNAPLIETGTVWEEEEEGNGEWTHAGYMITVYPGQAMVGSYQAVIRINGTPVENPDDYDQDDLSLRCSRCGVEGVYVPTPLRLSTQAPSRPKS